VTEALYERYKDALRRGHIAALRGRHAAALAAYADAASIAPDRPLPHVSIGTTYLRLERPDEALVAFDAALMRAPSDEQALDGRAGALVALGRRAEAAESLDRIADGLEAAGRVADACDTARRALELAESRARRRHVTELVARLREAGPDEVATAALGRALHVLEGDARRPPRRSATAAEREGDGSSPVGSDVSSDREPETRVPEAIDPLELVAAAELAIEAGDPVTGRVRLLEAIEVHRRLSQSSAALDVAVRALALAPLDTEVHLALVDLYLDRGWRMLARDKLVLLARLARAGGDEQAGAAIRSAAAARLPDDDAIRAALG
jgi:tetratricopeptide (TPR) repeat protein